MKICMVISTPFPPKEGIGYYTYNLSRKLIDKGHEIVVITRGSFKKTQREVIDGIEVIRAPFIPIYPLYIKLHSIFVNKIFKSLESTVDIVHIHTPLSPLIKTDLPIITTVHTPMLTDNRYIKISSFYSFLSKISARLVSYPLELKLLHNSNTITTVSKSISDELKENYVHSDKIKIVGNGVDENFFNFTHKRFQDDKKYILYVGRIDREKGLFDLLECAKYICNDRSDVFFILAGLGRDLNNLKKRVKKENLHDRFTFLGQVNKDQLVKLYQKSTLFVFPSYHEGLPSVILEAMSCGLPVITTNVRGNRDLISDRENGIMVPPRNPKKLAKTISSLLDNKKLCETFSKKAREIIEKNYTWDLISSRFLKYYELLMEAKP